MGTDCAGANTDTDVTVGVASGTVVGAVVGTGTTLVGTGILVGDNAGVTDDFPETGDDSTGARLHERIPGKLVIVEPY